MDLQQPVSTIMSTDLKTVHPNDNIALVDELFKKNRIHHLPVIGEDDEIVGIISKSDFLYLIRGFTQNEVDRFREAAMRRAFKVHEIMADHVETILENEPIKKAVSVLAENRFRALPVINRTGKLVGIVTTHDLIDMLNT